MKQIAYVAMSGGVDSSVAAALLQKQGYEVTGVFFKPWQAPGAVCNWKQDRLDAMRVAAKLGILFRTWDFSKEYKKNVADYMIREYKAGRTPNPDVMCNKEIKFGLFLKKALSEGADFIATGHYARVKDDMLYVSIDKNKDQSYFLWTLTQKQLKHCLFPVGSYIKPHVRAMAKKYGLPTAEKKDSQGVCFIGELDMKDFLSLNIKKTPGTIKLAGQDIIIGTHDGVAYYTIGQRHGLDIDIGGGPYYVASKDMKKNILYVSREKIECKELAIEDVNWISDVPKKTDKISVRIRYRSELIPVKIDNQTIRTNRSFTAASPGQSAVFYKGDKVLGGGVIA